MKITITVGAGRQNPIGQRCAVPTNGAGPVEALAQVLRSLPSATDTWWSGHVFDGNRRQEKLWLGSAVAMVDCDYHVTGENKPTPPEDQRDTFRSAAQTGRIPGSLFHLTPHGARVAFVLSSAVTDPQQMKAVVRGACELVQAALFDVGLAEINGRGYVVDTAATDLARFMFAPNATVDGEARVAEIIVMQPDAYEPAELAAHATAALPPPVASPNRTAKDDDLDDAAARWNGDHPISLPLPGRGDCPVCRGKGGWGALPQTPGKWFCWHVNHPSNVGHRTDRGTFGDSLDVAAHEQGKPRIEVLRADGYLKERCGATTKAGKICASTELFIDGKCKFHSESDAAKSARWNERRASLAASRTATTPPLTGASRPTIRITTDQRAVIDAGIAALREHPDLYQRGGKLVHVAHDVRVQKWFSCSTGTPRIVLVAAPRLREMLSEVAVWEKYVKKKEGGDWVEVHPEEWLVQAILARAQWPDIRPLEAVVETPALRHDGTILDAPGYDSCTGLLLAPTSVLPPIPSAPTLADAQVAAGHLLDVVSEFPFAEPVHRAAWLAAVLTLFSRHAFEGPAPLFLIDANVRGAGKSLLADAAGEIGAGRPMARLAPSDNDEEERKRITAIAVSGDPIVLIDNVAGSLGSPALDAALTGVDWLDRVLGATEMVRTPLLVSWFATGNNVVLDADTARRCLHIRLDSPDEIPEERTGFRRPNLLRWLRTERPRLAAAALTILRAFFITDHSSDPELTPWGSFDGWSRLVRAAVVWVGAPDPGETRRELRESSDRDFMALRDLVEGWADVATHHGGKCTAAMAVAWLDAQASAAKKAEAPVPDHPLRRAIAELVTSKRGEQLVSTKSLGRLLAKYDRRVVGGKALVKVTGPKGSGTWWSVDVPKPISRTGDLWDTKHNGTQAHETAREPGCDDM